MEIFDAYRDQIFAAFWTTIQLTVYSAIGALILGTVLAAMRLAPVPVLNWLGAAYVNVVRNTPLTLLLFAVALGMPKIDINLSYFTFAVIAVGCYTSAVIAEAVRSGINTVPLGQAEAARSLGMTFGQTLRLVVLPQALRAVVPPVGSLLIAMVRNTAIAGGFNVLELLGQYRLLLEYHDVLWVFFWIAVGYLIITLTLSAFFAFLERRLAVAR